MKYFFNTNLFSKSKGISLGKCEAIDYLHFITAKTYDMKIISHDGDMITLEEKYSDFKTKQWEDN